VFEWVKTFIALDCTAALVGPEGHTEHIITLCGKETDFLNIKAGGSLHIAATVLQTVKTQDKERAQII
jgi:hypothetical protein